ncbi:4,5-dihydroxyphthalate decarboxylase (plasmid) [Roseomonas mucosa]|uniref:4,5-dihydroxyphthalate decarboxylase n=1 Tax=Roseomonas mucosa TaxID=207340 RepID=A0A4Y1MSF0_9PROT|nr:ABC transporter substrate-binding protein [Roseomonas mucosa]AWV20543.1 4,5-dihydroxyphthalate decarboxylase [Roseomonas mucosa]MDT8278094.1 ABC transporter substrate-binding protein [Roseomonas mucosa]MDT8356080.1 ABC transporter substrate-binding protein [Roseomonas mucosa]MDU7521537.1 ABC transporter substrate-binding protein [Roseomonas mucosa]
MTDPTVLRSAIGRYPHSAPVLDGQVTSLLLRLEDARIKPVSRAFAPMVREGRFEVSEMAIATFLMAKAAGKPLVLLPVVMAARFQEAALLCRADSPVAGPIDLAGRRLGVRAYSQTTGMWLRGCLLEEFGLRPSDLHWVTFEDAHLAEYRDPPWAERAPAGSDMMAMLEKGALDAVIVGNDVPEDPNLRTVFPDPVAAGEAFRARYGFKPVNHLLVMRGDVVARRPDLAAELVRLFRDAPMTGHAALDPALLLASRFCAEQQLLPAPLTLEEIWEGLPAGIG